MPNNEEMMENMVLTHDLAIKNDAEVCVLTWRGVPYAPCEKEADDKAVQYISKGSISACV